MPFLLLATRKIACSQTFILIWLSLENGADLDGERLAAVAALPHPDAGGLPFQPIVLVVDNAAVGTHRAMRPDASFHEFVGGFLGVEVWGGEDRHRSSLLSILGQRPMLDSLLLVEYLVKH